MNPGKIHRKQFIRLLKTMGEPITVRQPVARSATTDPVAKVIGARGTEYSFGATQDVTVLWRNGSGKILDHDATPSRIALLGKVNNLDAVVRCLLEDVLVESTNKQGATIFDTAKDVVYNGNSFKVVDTDRSGMPLEGPYILWVALRKTE